MKFKFWIIFISVLVLETVSGTTNVLDPKIFEDVLDSQLCEEQLSVISGNILLASKFLDSGIRIPRGLLDGNFADLGNYYQCLSINEDIGTSVIGGKYCSISVPFEQRIPTSLRRGEYEWTDFSEDMISDDVNRKAREYSVLKNEVQKLSGNVGGSNRNTEELIANNISLTLAVCIPKTCTTNQALDTLLDNSGQQFNYTELYCRLLYDKTFVAADYVAFSIFGLIAIVTIISTSYDVRQTVFLQKDAKSVNQLYKAFSVFSNSTKLVSYSLNPKVIECLDGIRTLAMAWIIIGHTFSTHMQISLTNPIQIVDWLSSFRSALLTTAPVTVDTFFVISGLLLVYTTVGKMNGRSLLRNLHKFYLLRYLRMIPVLATAVLLMASWFNWVADGPYWQPVMRKVNNCRGEWWATLLLVQNYVSSRREGKQMCLGHTWYAAIDFQLHLISPLVLFFVLRNRMSAWLSLSAGMAVSLAIVIYMIITNDFPSTNINVRSMGNPEYSIFYYINTLTRSPPFFVGMIFGYLINIGKGKKNFINKIVASLMWLLTVTIMMGVTYLQYRLQSAEKENPVLDDVVNILMRPTWSVAVGWMILACATGYGGPLNWFLSLRCWKLPSKLTYALYIFHYPLIIMMNSTALSTVYFSESAFIYRFFADLMLSLLVAFLVTLFIDVPISNITNMYIKRGNRSKDKSKATAADINEQSAKNGE